MREPTILLVDDSPTNLYVLEHFFEDEDHPDYRKYEIVKAKNGQEALSLLENDGDMFDAVLLDIMMPEMDGIEVLRRIKKNDALKTLPVILQTARAASNDIEKGLQAGAFYYLTKPVDQNLLLPIVKTAVDDSTHYKRLKNEIEELSKTMVLFRKCSLEIQTMEEVHSAAALLANIYPTPEKAVLGLSELMCNAVEHGNLGISYDEKTELIEKGSWISEVERRISLSENSNKRVLVEVKKSNVDIRIRIKDDGSGFDWKQYLTIDAERAMDNHGRGIAMSEMISFDSIEYRGTGNEVVAVKML